MKGSLRPGNRKGNFIRSKITVKGTCSNAYMYVSFPQCIAYILYKKYVRSYIGKYLQLTIFFSNIFL